MCVRDPRGPALALKPHPCSTLSAVPVIQFHSVRRTDHKLITLTKMFSQMELWAHISSCSSPVDQQLPGQQELPKLHRFILYFCGESAPERSVSLARHLAPLQKDIFLSRMILMN